MLHPIGIALVLASCALALTGASEAAAYTIQTQISAGCHEAITEDALRTVRRAFGFAKPLPSTGSDDDAIIGDVPFEVPDDFADIGSTTLLLGVRDNDVKDLSPTALDQLAQLTADPATQREHCLRSEGEDEPDGTSRAVDDCRAFIREKLLASLDGLGADGAPDGSIRTPLTTSFALRGKLTVSVPLFYLYAGQAIHAIQDSFTHTFRKPGDPHRITVTLDWIDYADNDLNEATEGPPHMSQLDRCDDPDELRATRHRLAIEASAAALQIALDPTLSRDTKATAFEELLDVYVIYDGSGGCSAANQWCNAAENQYRPSACLCGLAGTPAEGQIPTVLAALLACALAWRRAGRVKRGRHVATLAGLVVALAPRSALADDKTPAPASPPPSAQPSSTEPSLSPDHGPMAALAGKSHSGEPGREDKAGAFFGHLAFGGSYDHAALAVAAGAKYQLFKKWMFGLDAEWNPWLPVEPFGVRAGTANVYASVLRRYQMAIEAVNFRTTAALGGSMLLIDLPGAPKGSFGPLFGVSFIGVEFKLTPGFFLVVDPTYLVLAVPHTTGTPLVYYQYRFQIGLEFGG